MGFDPRTPFRAGDAAAAGVSSRRLGSPSFRRIVRGVYVAADAAADPILQARAALLVAGPDAFVSHHQAARLYRAVVPDDPVLHASVHEGRHRSRVPDVSVHLSRREPTTFRGVPVTTPADTFLDLAATLSLVDLVVLGDSLVRHGRTTPGSLVSAAASGPTRHRRAAALAASLVRDGVDSAMETRTRLLLVFAGLPEPDVNLVFRTPAGDVARRLDMGYREGRLALEYDGRQHADSVQQWEGDVARREEFASLGWRIITLLAKDLYRTPALTLARVVDARRQVGLSSPPLRDDWRRYFPGHG